jgi:3-oxoadipate enol-lactonase
MPKVLANGIEIEYEERGQGAPVIFLHGSGVDWRCWAPQIPVFSPHYRMIMPVMRGHGNSGYLPRTDNYHALMATDLRHFMDALGIRHAPVVGLSMGAVVALRFAHMYPDYVEKLVSVCGYSELPSFGSGALLWLGNAIYSMMSMKTIVKVIDSGLKTIGASDLTRRVIRESIAIDKETFIKLKFVRLPNFTAELGRITAPTLVMGGDGIKFEAKGSRTIFEQIPDARLAIFHGGFDPLSTERQETHDAMILDFLAGRPIKSYPGVTYQEKDRQHRERQGMII